MTIELNAETAAGSRDDDCLIPFEEGVEKFLRVAPRTGYREVAAGRLPVLYVADRPFLTRPIIRQYIADRLAEATEKRKAIDARYAAQNANRAAKRQTVEATDMAFCAA